MNALKSTNEKQQRLIIPGRKKNLLKVHYAPADDGGTSWHWCWLPAKLMNDQEVAKATVSRALDLTADITIIQRQQKPEIIGGIQAIQRTGGVVFYWLEDQIWLLPWTSPVRKEYTADRQRSMEKIIAACDGAVCSSEPLADYMRRHNRNTHVLPHLLLEKWATQYQPKTKRRDKTIRILWTTTAHHIHDFGVIEHVLKDIVHKYPHVKVVLWGFVTKNISEMIPHTNLEYYDWVTIDNYIKCLTAMEADIGIAPLQEGDPYNRAKTPLKFLEYGLMGITPVVSNVPAYKCVEDRVTGMVPKTNKHKHWVDALSELIEDPKLRKDITKNAGKWVREHHSDRSIDEHMRVYHGTWKEKKEKE